MAHDYCKECERSDEELAELNISLNNDDYCEECFPKLMKEWQEEQDALDRYWRSTRL